MKAFVSFVSIAAGAVALTGAAWAQGEPKDGGPQILTHDVVRVGPVAGGAVFEKQVFGVGGAVGGPDVVEFVSAEASIAGKVVKGAPYSAEAVTETSQTLADGNRIVRKSGATTYRDSEGRSRREMTLSAIGSADAPTFVTINDPVVGASYHLDSKTKTARKLPALPGMVSFGPDAKMARARAGAIEPRAGAIELRSLHAAGEKAVAAGKAEAGDRAFLSIHTSPAMQIQLRGGSEPKTESLGKQAIDGIVAEGTRTTITIPAGEIGNEREIEVVSERWYSSELQTVILSKHSDPRMGETVYKLTGIKRGDPHPSLFQIPADYTVVNDEPGVRFMRKIDK